MKAELIWQIAESLRANLNGSHRVGLETLYFLSFFNEKINLDELQNFSRPTLKEEYNFLYRGVK